MRLTTFELLGEPVRLRIIEILATGEHTAGELAEVITGEFGVGRTAVSHHLRTLLDSDFAVVRVEGQSRVYRLERSAMDRLDLAVDRLHTFWDARYGWPYLNDPATPVETSAQRRARRRRGRGMRGRREGWISGQSVPAETDESEDEIALADSSSSSPYRIDPWQLIPD